MAGLTCGQVFGFSVYPRTIENYKTKLADSHTTFAKGQLSKASNVRILF